MDSNALKGHRAGNPGPGSPFGQVRQPEYLLPSREQNETSAYISLLLPVGDVVTDCGEPADRSCLENDGETEDLPTPGSESNGVYIDSSLHCFST